MKKWLQLFRAQTAPADICLVLLPYLMGAYDVFVAIILGIFVWFLHGLTFGHNSLLDSCIIPEKGKPPPDFSDPSKSHHPLIRGDISLHRAKFVIFWGLGIVAVIAVIITYLVAKNLPLAIISFFLYWVFGVLYNEGLSKESLFGFVPISLCFVFLGFWGYFLSHNTIDLSGWILMLYFFFAILFQISYSGHLKEIEVKERSNILTKMGAKVDVTWKGEKMFNPGHAYIYGFVIKMVNIVLAAILLQLNYSLAGNIPFFLFGGLALYYLVLLISPREYVRSKELLNMSIEEIATIFLPLGILLPWHEALTLMAVGVLYFFIINKLIWKVPYPKV